MYNYGPDCVNPELAKADLMNVGFPKYEIEKGLLVWLLREIMDEAILAKMVVSKHYSSCAPI